MTKPFYEEEFGPREIVPASLKLIVQSAYYLNGKTRNRRPSLGQVSSCFDRSTLASVWARLPRAHSFFFRHLCHRWLIVIGPESDYEQQYVSCCLECMPNQKNLLVVIIDNHFGCLCLRRTTMPVTLLLAASFNWWRGPTQFLSLTEEKIK